MVCRFKISLGSIGLQDKDKNGYVDVDELTNLHSTTKERLTMLEAKKILEVRWGCAVYCCRLSRGFCLSVVPANWRVYGVEDIPPVVSAC